MGNAQFFFDVFWATSTTSAREWTVVGMTWMNARMTQTEGLCPVLIYVANGQFRMLCWEGFFSIVLNKLEDSSFGKKYGDRSEIVRVAYGIGVSVLMMFRQYDGIVHLEDNDSSNTEA